MTLNEQSTGYGMTEGWFDVDAYQTKESYDGPELADDSLEGVLTLADALAYANAPEFDGYYQVVVVAYGEHADFETGEPVYSRFDRDALALTSSPAGT